jgi:hypothetical protein
MPPTPYTATTPQPHRILIVRRRPGRSTPRRSRLTHQLHMLDVGEQLGAQVQARVVISAGDFA